MANNNSATVSFIRTSGYTLRNTNLLIEALNTTGLYRPGSNQSLALVSDSILQTIVSQDWYPSKEPQGASTKAQTCL
jgi:hypothetical protein